jgi:hypothetical protein
MPKIYFTSLTARLASAKGHEAKRLRKANSTTAAILAAVPPPPPPDMPDVYLAQRLTRVRAQLDRIDAMLLVESNPQHLDRLAAACARLSEVERQLAGRPAPGAYRPSAPRRRVESQPLVPE